MPDSFAELVLWLGVSLAAGIGEEFVFRGYLQQQFTKWFSNLSAAITLSAAIFGCLHYYQGGAAAIEIGCLGALYSFVSLKRKNLRSVMIAHFLHDFLTGAFLYLKYR